MPFLTGKLQQVGQLTQEDIHYQQNGESFSRAHQHTARTGISSMFKFQFQELNEDCFKTLEYYGLQS